MRVPTLILALLVAPAAEAKSLRDSIFPGNQGCYLRQYSKSHLADHPNQLVTQIGIGPETSFQHDNTAIILNVAIRMRGTSERFYGVAYCENAGDHLFCGMEGDAGAFALAKAKDGAVLLTVARRGMAFEGARDFVEISGTSGDDRSFLMPRVPPDACP